MLQFQEGKKYDPGQVLCSDEVALHDNNNPVNCYALI